MVKERREPAGAVRLLTFPPYRKFVQLPALFVILSERDVTYRPIFLDGRPRPVDPAPTFNGYSTGKWEGDTLVVQTNGLRDGTMTCECRIWRVNDDPDSPPRPNCELCNP